jgi:hypothetical protein
MHLFDVVRFAEAAARHRFLAVGRYLAIRCSAPSARAVVAVMVVSLTLKLWEKYEIDSATIK